MNESLSRDKILSDTVSISVFRILPSKVSIQVKGPNSSMEVIMTRTAAVELKNALETATKFDLKECDNCTIPAPISWQCSVCYEWFQCDQCCVIAKCVNCEEPACYDCSNGDTEVTDIEYECGDCAIERIRKFREARKQQKQQK